MGQFPRRTALSILASTALASGATAGSPITAIVEDVQAPATSLRFMDYVNRGQVIIVGSKGRITLSYFKSCLRETIVGGHAIVGDSRSKVSGGTVERTKVDCDRGTLDPAGSATESASKGATPRRADGTAALLVRSLGSPKKTRPGKRIFGLSPVFRMTDAVKVIRITSADPKAEFTVAVSGRHVDLAERKIILKPGATYTAKTAKGSIVFHVDPSAKPGRVPILSRLLRF